MICQTCFEEEAEESQAVCKACLEADRKEKEDEMIERFQEWLRAEIFKGQS